MTAGRRDGMMGEGLIRGLRLEPELARAVTAYAEDQAAMHETKINMASAARDLLRRGLKATAGRHSCDQEAYFRALAEARKRIAKAVQE